MDRQQTRKLHSRHIQQHDQRNKKPNKTKIPTQSRPLKKVLPMDNEETILMKALPYYITEQYLQEKFEKENQKYINQEKRANFLRFLLYFLLTLSIIVGTIGIITK